MESDVENEIDLKVNCLQSDNEREYVNDYFKKFIYIMESR